MLTSSFAKPRFGFELLSTTRPDIAKFKVTPSDVQGDVDLAVGDEIHLSIEHSPSLDEWHWPAKLRIRVRRANQSHDISHLPAEPRVTREEHSPLERLQRWVKRINRLPIDPQGINGITPQAHYDYTLALAKQVGMELEGLTNGILTVATWAIKARDLVPRSNINWTQRTAQLQKLLQFLLEHRASSQQSDEITTPAK